MKAVIIAGGRGTRLARVSQDTPKVLVPIDGTPVIERQIKSLKAYGCGEVFILLGYHAVPIKKRLGDGSSFGVRLTYIEEKEPLGTAGAFKQLESILTEEAIVIYGDLVFDMDIARFLETHEKGGSIATLAAHPNSHPFDSDLLETDDNDTVTCWHPKEGRPRGYYQNLVSAGIYILSPKIFKYIPASGASDFGKDIFPLVLARGEKLIAYRTSEYIKDMGTEARYAEVERDVENHLPQRLNLRKRQKAVFFDRDDTINKDLPPRGITTPEEFILLPHAAEAVQMIDRSEYLAICVTNQPGIAKNFLDFPTLKEIHDKMESLLAEKGAFVHAIFYCPHHPQAGFPDERKEYKIACSCRKPEAGMLSRAAERFNIDLTRSYMVGDSERDILCGKRAGLTTILLSTDNDTIARYAPHKAVPDFRSAVDFILSRS